MQSVKRFFEDCPVCENRGLLCVGEDDQDFPCPYCNAWCSGCLEKLLPDRQRPLVGALLAAVRRTRAGLELFEGYLCDWHCAEFNAYSMITPAMIGGLKPGDPYIIVQQLFQTHAFLVLYGYAEAQNHRALEAQAFQAVAAQRHARFGWNGFYACPPDLAALATVPDWVTWRVGEKLDCRVLPSGARLTAWSVSES